MPSFARTDSYRPVAVISGASSGLGKEFATSLARAGHDLVVLGRDRTALDVLAEKLGHEHGTACLVLAGDLADEQTCETVCLAIESSGRDIDILINNAGFGAYGPFSSGDSAEQLGMIRVNVIAPTLLTRRFLPGMLRRGRGRIMNVASVASFMPGPHLAVYYATKAYVLHFTEALACECAGSGVTVTAFCPGPTTTGFQLRAGLEQARFVRGHVFPSAAAVAADGIAAMMAGRVVGISGLGNRLLVFWLRLLPRSFVRAAMLRIQAPT